MDQERVAEPNGRFAMILRHRWVSSTLQFLSTTGRYLLLLLHLYDAIADEIAARITRLCELVGKLLAWQLLPENVDIRSVDCATFDRSWQLFRRLLERQPMQPEQQQQQAGLVVRGGGPGDDVEEVMLGNHLFGYFDAHLRPGRSPDEVDGLTSDGVMEIRLRGDELVVTTRHGAASPDYVAGAGSLAFDIAFDSVWLPYFLHHIGKFVRSGSVFDGNASVVPVLPMALAMAIIRVEIELGWRQGNWWRFRLLVWAFLMSRIWWPKWVMPWDAQ